MVRRWCGLQRGSNSFANVCEVSDGLLSFAVLVIMFWGSANKRFGARISRNSLSAAFAHWLAHHHDGPIWLPSIAFCCEGAQWLRGYVC